MTPTSTEERFNEIYAVHRHAVHAYFLGRTSDPAQAPDLLQETFLRVWRRLDEVADLAADKQRAWIFTVARNLTIDTYRSQATRKATEAAVRSETRESTVTDQPEIRAEHADQLRILASAIGELPEAQRIAITMQASGGLTSAQIGTALGEPAGTIRYRLSEARKTLARKLEGASA
ncbi:MAG TPA: RNA polymerase sigma factor [Mycobacteriales bacterium]|nr:RNA polymerase sigma factor [Mycobacteriales bacterium]